MVSCTVTWILSLDGIYARTAESYEQQYYDTDVMKSVTKLTLKSTCITFGHGRCNCSRRRTKLCGMWPTPKTHFMQSVLVFSSALFCGKCAWRS